MDGADIFGFDASVGGRLFAWRGLSSAKNPLADCALDLGEGLLFTVSTSSCVTAWRVDGGRGGEAALSHWKSLGHFPGGATRLALLPSAAAAAADAGGGGATARAGGGRSGRCGGGGSAAARASRAPSAASDPLAGGWSRLRALSARGAAAPSSGGGNGGGGGVVAGGLLLSSSLDGAVVAWSAASLEPVWAMKLEAKAGGAISALGCAGTDRMYCAAGDTVRWGAREPHCRACPPLRAPRAAGKRRSAHTALAPPLCNKQHCAARGGGGPRRPQAV